MSKGYQYVLYVNGVEVNNFDTQQEALAYARGNAMDSTWTIWYESWS